jgi:3-deoxy-manno-octulosonate cytidylyltransferase (CMP-KDO synthetase)
VALFAAVVVGRGAVKKVDGASESAANSPLPMYASHRASIGVLPESYPTLRRGLRARLVLPFPVHGRGRSGQTTPHVVAIIPARYQSTRLPGKPLIPIAGRPLVEHVFRRASAVPGIARVIVATDDERIREAVTRFGGECVMTSPTHRSGTDRIAEVAAGLPCDLVVNVQGDEPLLDPASVTAGLSAFDDADVQIATLRRRLVSSADLNNPHIVKVVVDQRGDALYFSRAPIPWARDAEAHFTPAVTFKHIGLYLYRRDFLLAFASWPPTPLEQAESLEQLRPLERGHRIRTVETAYDSVGVDTPEDLALVRHRLEP